MSLRLRVVSDHRRQLAERHTIVFGTSGGSIGRSSENDWALPDPVRYVSAHHARVHYRDGHFYLEDLSTNGVFVNDQPEALSKLGSSGYRLKNGDVLRLGDYQIVVALENEQAAEIPEIDSAAVPTSIHALHPLGRAVQTDIGAMLDLEELLVSDSGPAADSGSFQPVNAYGQALAPSPRATSLATKRAAVSEPSDDSLARRIARLAKAAGRDSRGTAAPALYDVQSGLHAFCRGAGIDPEKLPAEAQTRLLHLTGQLVREALVGLKDLERSRSEIRDRFRIELPPPEPDDPRPSLGRATVDELLIQVLVQHESRSIDAVQWLREQVSEIKAHEQAGSQATRAAFVEFLDRLDPAELEARFERAARRGKARSADKAQYWELFTTFYRNLIEMPADHLPHTFVEAFAAAYREAIKKK
ncbi:MAG TPA: type VI secretion system-associated FHA domain protein TagH [Steroidobacteraceae bacterium]|jgi:type VI secretion system FHA domain protein|nr:type VI secretion system-associated FHA domain protein TagH [Steroidobacteraceae bacterium]